MKINVKIRACLLNIFAIVKILKKRQETLKHYLSQGFRRRERSMALFNRVNEFLNKVVTLSKWKSMLDIGGKIPQLKSESVQRSRGFAKISKTLL